MFFKNYRTVIFIGVVVAAALVLLSYSLKYDSGAGVVKKLVLEAATPVQRLFNASIEGVENAWLRYIHLVGLEEDNRSLKNKIAALQAELILYKEGYLEAQRLKKLLSLLEDRQYKFTAARVIAKEQAALSKTLWIDKGSAHGLKSGMPVLVPPGLIGRLTDVSWHSSKVLLLIDENSNVDVLIQRTRVQGIVRGAGSRGCVVRYISKVQDVKEGDVVNGTVRRITEFGAFVDIGGVQALLPVSEMTWGRVEDAKSLYKSGDAIEAVIINLDWENDRITLSFKDTLPDPWNDVVRNYIEGSIHKGRISRLTDFGAFVTLEAGVDGLLHISKLGKGKKIKHAQDVLTRDREIDVKIEKIDRDNKRISLDLASNSEEKKDSAEPGDDYKSYMPKAPKTMGTFGDLLSKAKKK
ncbi:MAG: hypothetical protein CVU72_00550 [Deltaproteobacteria bacterium HGW-Deltaproteobacteria-7]|nr:MAG: hypothetical protein CVU72_00550 [Deltaproteobacteria bacterium HGW-Deltaproteobacteria-7]